MLISFLSAAVISVPSCSWNEPGANRFQGSPSQAVHHYLDIPESTRLRLQRRMEQFDYDDLAEIRRDSIKGSYEYTDLRDMHFGKNRVCNTVNRENWKNNLVELGMVYCEDTHCLIVPTVCGNLSRVTRVKTLNPPTAPATSDVPGIAPVVIPFPAFDTPSFAEKVDTSPITNERIVRVPVFVPVSFPQDEPWWIEPPGFIIPPPAPPIPEPSTILLMLAGLIALAYKIRY